MEIEFFFDEHLSYELGLLSIVMTLAPNILLLAAVIRVRCMAQKLHNKAILQKEKVIMIHTVLFSLCICIFTRKRILM